MLDCVYLCSIQLCTVYTGKCVTKIVSFIYDYNLLKEEKRNMTDEYHFILLKHMGE